MMTPTRRFAIGLAATAVAVGVIRGVIASLVLNLPTAMARRIVLGQIVLSLFWVPVGFLALWIFTQRLARHTRVIAIVVLGTTSIFVEPTLVPVLGVLGRNPPPYWMRFLLRADTSLLFFLAVAGAAAAVAARGRQLGAELAAAQMETAVANAQLHVLTLQLHPHFLFNALNLVSQLAYESIEGARRTITNLRSLLVESLRHALHREVPLAEELRFLRAYLEIQEARFRGRLFSTIEIADGTERAAVPHLLLQPLVENAIIHGLSRRAGAGRLEISARRAGARLILSVRDDGEGLRGASREGIGLGNTRMRLGQLFGDDYRLDLAAGADRGTIVTVEIPYRVADTHDTPMPDAVVNDSLAAVEETTAAIEPTRVPPWIPIVASWAAIASLWTELRMLSQSPSNGLAWSTIMVSDALNAALWLVLTPVVIRYSQWASLAGPRSKRFVIAHVTGALIVGVGHTGLWIGVLYLVGSADLWPTIRSMFGWMIWDSGAYAAIVSLATMVTLTARIRDARVTIARRRARLTVARLAALRLRLQPHVLLGALDALERVVAIDAEQSEAAITRMGDLLRLLLARAEQEWAGVDEEVELLMAYLDVINAWRTGDDRRAVIVECGEQRIPAMLLPTLASVIGGSLDEMTIHERGGVIVIRAAMTGSALDQRALLELSERLAELYRGREWLESGRGPGGELFVRVEVPALEPALADSDFGYGLASA